MTYFKLDIPRINEEILNYRVYKKKYFDDIISAHRTLSSIQTAWDDINSRYFLENVKKNGNNSLEYFEYLDRLYSELDNFKNNINEICYKQGFVYNSVFLKFDDSELEYCKKYLSNAVYYLNNILNDISSDDFDEEYKNTINNFLYQIRKIRGKIKNLLNDLDSFSKSINNAIESSKLSVNRMEKFEKSFKELDYNLSIK